MKEQEDSLLKKKIKFMPALKRKRHKSDHCLNCGTTFDVETNYCPNCGQENDHNRASFRTLVTDFLHNYFSFDSKFGNSLFPFFFKPGFLTNQFIDGKRASYVNPVRLYLILSLAFFFIFNIVSRRTVDRSIETFDNALAELPDSTKSEVDQVLQEGLDELERDSVYLFEAVRDSSTDKKWIVGIERQDSSNEFFTDENIMGYWSMRKNKALSSQQMLDSLNTSSLTSFQYRLLRNTIRLDRAEPQIMMAQLLKNMPLMMMIILPFFALIIRLLYVRQDQYYITHLIHAVYLHSFAFVLYGLAFALIMLWPNIGESGILRTLVISGSIVTIHSYFSFYKVYQQKWGKTLFKFLIVGICYSWLLIFGMIGELFLSVLTF